MHIDLTRLREGRLSQQFTIGSQDPVVRGYEAQIRDPFRLEVDLVTPSPGTYIVTGQLVGTVLESCRRCLSPVTVAVADRFRVVYREGRELDLGDDDIVAVEPGATKIEIDREIRDRLFLETEWYPLCGEECRGICPVCGGNRNYVECGCQHSAPDLRWSALEALRDE